MSKSSANRHKKSENNPQSEAKPPVIWLNVLVFSITAFVALIVTPLYGYFIGFDKYHWIATILCIGYCGMSITAGYHRLWAHKTYQTNGVIRFIYAIGGAFALQNSALHWSSDHRVHHHHVDDNDKDPYSAKMGFWYSHIGWMLREYQKHRYDDYSNVKDLQKDSVVMWQHRNYLWLCIAVNFGIPLLIGFIHGDVVGMLLTAGFLRLVISHHTTFFINSLAHMWGSQPYTEKNTARDNGFLAFFTFGEGYHNFHHLFQFDYRNGIRWWQFDPTKWLIKTLSWLKLAQGLRKCDDVLIERARAQRLMDKTKGKLIELPNKDELISKLSQEFEIYSNKLSEYYQLKKHWVEAKKGQLAEKYDKNEVLKKYREFKVTLIAQKKQWLELNKQLALQFA